MIEQCKPGRNRRSRLTSTFPWLNETNPTLVSQTRAEVRAVNDAVRTALIARGKLGRAEHTIVALEAVDLTNSRSAMHAITRLMRWPS